MRLEPLDEVWWEEMKEEYDDDAWRTVVANEATTMMQSNP